MDLSLIPAMVGAPLCAFLAVLFLVTAARGFRPRPYGSLGWLALLGAVQLAAYYFARIEPDHQRIRLWAQVITAATILMGPGWVQLILAFTERPFKKWLAPLYGLAALFLALLPTRLLLGERVTEFGKLGIGLHPEPGPLFFAHQAFFVACIVIGLALLMRTIAERRRTGQALPPPLADTFAEEGLATILITVGLATAVGVVDALQLVGLTNFQLPIELGALFLIGGSAYATVQRFPRLLLRVEAQLAEVQQLNRDLEQRNREIQELARKNEELLNEEIRYLKTELAASSEGSTFGALVGSSPAMGEVFALVTKVAPQDTTVLLLGESGVGKEKIAREVHRLSPRAQRGFFAVNCGALTETLLESELFGHQKGAFTGAVSERPGIFQAAQGGTLFLDEVGEMSPALQVKLLRVLQEREVVPLGGSKPIAVDARIVAATNRNLDADVASGRFREDLFYRLNVIAIRVPPLRERSDDVPLLAAHFLKEQAGRNGKPLDGISEPAHRALLAYGWPGNVRELENVVERAVTLCDDRVVRLRDLPPSLLSQVGLAQASDSPAAQPIREAAARASKGNGAPQDAAAQDLALKELERRHILAMLEKYDWQRTKVSEILGINPSTLYRKLKTYGIEEPEG